MLRNMPGHAIILSMQENEDNIYLEIIQKIPVANKLKSAFMLYDLAHNRVAGEIKRQNPNITNTQLNKLVQERFSR